MSLFFAHTSTLYCIASHHTASKHRITAHHIGSNHMFILKHKNTVFQASSSLLLLSMLESEFNCPCLLSKLESQFFARKIPKGAIAPILLKGLMIWRQRWRHHFGHFFWIAQSLSNFSPTTIYTELTSSTFKALSYRIGPINISF